MDGDQGGSWTRRDHEVRHGARCDLHGPPSVAALVERVNGPTGGADEGQSCGRLSGCRCKLDRGLLYLHACLLE